MNTRNRFPVLKSEPSKRPVFCLFIVISTLIHRKAYTKYLNRLDTKLQFLIGLENILFTACMSTYISVGTVNCINTKINRNSGEWYLSARRCC